MAPAIHADPDLGIAQHAGEREAAWRRWSRLLDPGGMALSMQGAIAASQSGATGKGVAWQLSCGR